MVVLAAACNDEPASAVAGSDTSSGTSVGTTPDATTSATTDTNATTTASTSTTADATTTSVGESSTSSSTSDAATSGATDSTGSSEDTSGSSSDAETTSGSTSTEGPACMLPDEASSSDDGGTPLDLGAEGGCGNGVIELDEFCDDGNVEPGDGCENDCTSSDDVAPLWTLTMGGPNSIPDCGSGIVFDSQNNLIIGGYVLDDVWIRKYDPNYEELWTVTYPGLVTGSCTDTPLAVDSNDNIAFAGVTGEANNANFVFGLLDPDGTEIWSEIYDGPVNRADFVHGIAVDTQDNVIIVGTQENPMDDVEGAVLKYASDGMLLWSDFFDGGDTSQGGAWDVDTDPCDAVVVSGFSFSVATGADIVVRKYEVDGGLEWERTEATELTDWGYAIGADGQGRVVVAGSELQPPSTYPDFWLRQYDEAGNESWTILEDGGAAGGEQVFAVTTAPSGEFWASGITSPQQLNTDAWLRRYAPSGSAIWTRTIYFGGSSNSWRAVARAPDGRIAAAGSSQLPFPNDTEAHFAVYPP